MALDRHSLGVLFVYGIGEYKQGDTLIRCSDPLVEWLNCWSRDAEVDHPPALEQTQLAPDPGVPAHGVLRGQLPGDQAVDWVLAESWWSETFRPPGPMAVAPWVWSVGKRLARRQMRQFFSRQERSLRQFEWTLRRRLGPGARTAFYVLMLPLLLALFVVGPVFGWLVLAAIRAAAFAGTLLLIPLSVVPPLRPLVRRAQLIVTNGVGDSWVLKCSPTSLDAMVSRVERDLDWLEEQAETVAVVAHSQGAVVAHRALARRSDPRVRLFVTYGAALRLHYSEREGWRRGHEPLQWPGVAPEGWTAWSDFYAEWDVVAAGPVWRRREHHRRSDPVANNNSVLSDHGSYWDNPEQVVAPIAKELAALAGTRVAPEPRDKESMQLADLRRTNRVSMLTAARWLYLAGAGTALVFLTPGPLEQAGRWFVDLLQGTLFFILGGLGKRVGDQLDGIVAYYVIGALTITAAVAVLYRFLAVSAWKRWSAKALDRMYRRDIEASERRERALFGLTWLIVPAGLLAIWASVGPEAWIGEFRSEDRPMALGMDIDAVAWIYTGTLFLEFWIILMFIRVMSLSQPPRPLRDVSQVRMGENAFYALFDHRLGRNRISCCKVRVTQIGTTGRRLRVPVLEAPPAERIRIEVVEAASADGGTTPVHRVGDVKTLQGTERLTRWDEYCAWRERCKPDAPARPSSRRGALPRLRGARRRVAALADDRPPAPR